MKEFQTLRSRFAKEFLKMDYLVFSVILDTDGLLSIQFDWQ